tara:strand:+ start:614 stop:1012 length:399 start_codon:yes stop_codon:yes gene_type:complete
VNWDLEELRNKPNHVKERYAFWGALLLTGIITFVWLLSFSGSQSKEVVEEDETRSAISHYLREFRSQLGLLKGVLKREKEDLVEVDSETEEDQEPESNIVLPDIESKDLNSDDTDAILIEVIQKPVIPVVIE